MLHTVLYFLLTALAFVFVLGILVFVHEFGHFIMAKLSGVKVEEFSIGFPPRIFSFKRNETNYTIGLIPMGGYVKMLGEEDVSKDPRSYSMQSAWKRLAISVAGVFMNIVLAWLIITIAFIYGMTPMTKPAAQIGGKQIKAQIFVAEVQKNSAAEKADLKPGDQIIEGNGSVIQSTSDVSELTKRYIGQEINLKIRRNNEIFDKNVTLSTNESAPLGVGLVNQAVVRVVWYKAPLIAAQEVGGMIKYIFEFLGDFFRNIFLHGKVSDQVGGPVAIFDLSGRAARAGAVAFFQFIAMLSINLALLNILPFPALDGGRALFIILEKIWGKKIIKEEIENIIHTIGFALLIVLILLVTYSDIVKRIR